MSYFSFAGRAGATTGSITIGPIYSRTTDVMSSSRNLNTKENTGNLPMYTNRLALFIQKKFDTCFRRKDSVVLKHGGTVHLLGNRRELGGYFDYKAFGKYGSSEQQHGKDKSGESNLSEAREVHAESSKGAPTPTVPKASRRRVKEMLFRALPGLAADHEDWLRPTEEQIRKARSSFESHISKLDEDLRELETREASTALIEDARREKKRCEHCHGILKGAETEFETLDRRHRAEFWRCKLETRWKKLHGTNPATPDLFVVARSLRDVDAIAEKYNFVFLPQERCLLDIEIAVEELFDIQRSGMLDVEQFGDLIEALAFGWPGVVEDSQSSVPEDRANAAGCVRALAQLANKGALPREVLSSFREFDAINRALLLHAQTREADLKIAELQRREMDRQNKGQQRSARKSKGKGKERESDRAKTSKLDYDIDAIRNGGTKLAALHAELMESERNLRAVGIDIRGVRVDEFYIQGLDRNDPERRKKTAVMLARVALIQEEIAGLDKRFERRDTGGEATPRKFAARIYGISGNDEAGQPPTFVPTYSYPFEEGEVDVPIGALSEKAIEVRTAVDELLALGLTAADLEAMKLPEGIDEKRETIGNLGKMGFRNARDVKFQHKMHRKMRDRVFKTKAGRRALRSAFGLTTGQLAAEYLHTFFSSATGKHDNFNHGAKDRMVVDKMKDHWREIMGSDPPDKEQLALASRKIKKWRNRILEIVAQLGENPESDTTRIAEIGDYHERINKSLLAMERILLPRQRAFVQAMIRAAVLAARPRRTTGDRHFDPIDVYEASRHRKEIDEILKSWGMDTASYEVMIDLVAFSRAEDSDLAPGTVTAQQLNKWKKELDPEKIFGAKSSAGRSIGKPELPTGARIKRTPKKAMKVVVEHFSGKRFREMDAALIDRIVLSLPAMADMDKVSIRVHSIGQAGFTASAGMGARGSLAGGAGGQHGWILKREGDHFLVRCLGGAFGYVQPGVGVGHAFGVGEVGANGFLNGAGWSTPGVTLSFPIRLDEHGQEDFSKIQAYVRALLTGDLPSTAWMAENAGLWYQSDKNGGHGKVAGTVELSVGPAMETPLGPASAGVTIGVGTEDRRRIRRGTNDNAFFTGKVTKMTDMTFFSAAIGVGLNFGYKYDPGIADVASAAATAKLGIGASASAVLLKYGNLSLYDDGIDVSFDVTLDIGPVDMSRSTSIEEALDQLRPDVAARLKPLLDKETTLENGSKVIFRDGLEKLLKMFRYNDGFLMEWGLRPEVKKEIGRRLRRVAMIRQQHMLETLEARAENEPDPVKKKELERAYLLLRTEVFIHEDRIREMKDPKNLSYFKPLAIYIMPLLFQWDEWTVLDIIGMAKVTHIGVRLQDDNCVCVPIPQEDDREAPSTVALDTSIEKRRESVTVIPSTSSDDDEAKVQNTLDLLSGSLFPTASRHPFSTRSTSIHKEVARY